MTRPDIAALELATRFHEAYERLAPSFGYETRPETRTFDPESKNGRLMVAVCREILRAPAHPAELSNNPGELPAPAAGEDEALLRRAGEVADYCEHKRDLSYSGTVRQLIARIRTLLADVARLKQAFDDEEKAGDMHRAINRRAAEALGKPQEGERSSWHDIPEEITALRARAEAGEAMTAPLKPCAHVVPATDWSQLWVGRRSVHAAANVTYYEVRRKMRGYSAWIPACKITKEKLAQIEALLGGKPSVFLRALADLAEEVGE